MVPNAFADSINSQAGPKRESFALYQPPEPRGLSPEFKEVAAIFFAEGTLDSGTLHVPGSAPAGSYRCDSDPPYLDLTEDVGMLRGIPAGKAKFNDKAGCRSAIATISENNARGKFTYFIIRPETGKITRVLTEGQSLSIGTKGAQPKERPLASVFYVEGTLDSGTLFNGGTSPVGEIRCNTDRPFLEVNSSFGMERGFPIGKAWFKSAKECRNEIAAIYENNANSKMTYIPVSLETGAITEIKAGKPD
jgi:hypothetical protein